MFEVRQSLLHILSGYRARPDSRGGPGTSGPRWGSVMNRLFEWLMGPELRRRIDDGVARRTRVLAVESARIGSALRAANVHIFFQDRDLRYRSVISPLDDGARLIGRTDQQVLPSTERDAVIAIKRQVIATGKPDDCEVSYVTPEGRALFALHVEPAIGEDNAIEGLCCAAVDLSKVRSLESEQRRLTEELKTAVERYGLALRESNVTVFTQDRDLRYTSISNPLAGLAIADIVGRTDETILAEDARSVVIAFKRRCLDDGRSGDEEVGIGFHGRPVRWYDMHIEPLRDVTGAVTGLIGAAVDITKRKNDEEHLRLLLRELTHRSKNLLAVIQAVARQTARHAASTEEFIAQFDARLQGLATSHDLLIEDGWHGASLEGLVRLQVQPFLEAGWAGFAIEGPTVLLKPDAAQAFGMALHELGTNARKFGALSTSDGRISIKWRRLPLPEGDGVAFEWIESGGPSISVPVVRRFGSMVIERNLAQAIGGKVRLAFSPAGVQCEIVIPAMHLVGFVDRPNA
jgi:PAS domain S-box-containing protein